MSSLTGLRVTVCYAIEEARSVISLSRWPRLSSRCLQQRVSLLFKQLRHHWQRVVNSTPHGHNLYKDNQGPATGRDSDGRDLGLDSY